MGHRTSEFSGPWQPRYTIAETHFAFIGLSMLSRNTDPPGGMFLSIKSMPQLVFHYQSGSRFAGNQRSCQVAFEYGTETEQEAFCQPRWNLARIEPVPLVVSDSYSQEKSELARQGYDTAWPAEEVLKRILGQAISPVGGLRGCYTWARTRRTTLPGGRVCIKIGSGDIIQLALDTPERSLADGIAIFRKRPTQEQPAQS